MSRLDHVSQAARINLFAAGEDVAADKCGSCAFVNHLRQLVTAIERTVAEPELRASVLAWRAQSYQEFFTLSDTCDAASALRAYAGIDPIRRRSFEAIVAAFDKLAADAARVLAQASGDLELELELPLRTMRLLIDRAVTLVDDGDSFAAEAAGRRANRLYAK